MKVVSFLFGPCCFPQIYGVVQWQYQRYLRGCCQLWGSFSPFKLNGVVFTRQLSAVLYHLTSCTGMRWLPLTLPPSESLKCVLILFWLRTSALHKWRTYLLESCEIPMWLKGMPWDSRGTRKILRDYHSIALTFWYASLFLTTSNEKWLDTTNVIQWNFSYVWRIWTVFCY